MLNKISLAKKITTGFVIILILLLAIAFVGRFSLRQVVEKINSAGKLQSLVDHVSGARQNEKKFILTNNIKDVQKVNQELSLLKGKTKEILSIANSKDLKIQMNRVLKKLDKYDKAFSNYVMLARRKNLLMKDMNNRANMALKKSTALRDGQKLKYDKLMEESSTKIAKMRLRVKYSIDIHKSFIKAKGYRMTLSKIDIAKNDSLFAEWEGQHKNLLIFAEKLKPFLSKDVSKKVLNTVIKAQKVLIKKAKKFFFNKDDDTRFAMIKAANVLLKSIIVFNQEMQEQLEFYLEDVQIFSGEILELSSGVAKIGNVLLKTRILEKEYIRQEDSGILKKIINNMNKIDKVIVRIKENIDDEEKTKALDPIGVAVRNYFSSFKAYADLTQHQSTAKLKMEENAREIQGLCLKLKKLQLKAMQSQINQSQGLITFVSVFALVFGVIIALFLIRIIIKPIQKLASALKEISEGDGDLTKRIEIKTKDEIGDLANSFNAFIGKLNDIIIDISVNSETVTAASGEVLSVSDQMSESADDLFSRSNSVATAAKEMSTNMDSVAAASEQASTNLDMVSGSAGQMKITLNEVAKNCDKAREISENAADQVNTASDRVGLLGNSAKEISKVTEVITDIAAQINLLALNATIEAARAGEAGKGFAVVAEEIKGLATQTAKAILDIQQQIDSIQTSTGDTVKDVGKITNVISSVTEIVAAISSAIEEQSASAKEIAQNIEQASVGMTEVNENVSKSSKVSSDIAREIAKVNAVAETMNVKSSQTNKSAGDLSRLSLSLKDMISVFKVSREKSSLKTELDLDYNESDIVDLMPWSSKFETSLTTIDDHHKKLVSMVNHLHRAMKMKSGNKEAGKILDELAKYTVYHFNYEEKLFDEYGYKEKNDHKMIHEDLVTKVVNFQNEFNAGDAVLSIDLMQFLTDWLKNHILVTDMAYVTFFKEKGIR